MSLFNRVKKKEVWKFVEANSFDSPICCGKPMELKVYSSGYEYLVFQCKECGKVIEGEVVNETE